MLPNTIKSWASKELCLFLLIGTTLARTLHPFLRLFLPQALFGCKWSQTEFQIFSCSFAFVATTKFSPVLSLSTLETRHTRTAMKCFLLKQVVIETDCLLLLWITLTLILMGTVRPSRSMIFARISRMEHIRKHYCRELLCSHIRTQHTVLFGSVVPIAIWSLHSITRHVI